MQEVDAPVRFERTHVQVAAQLANRVDANHLAERVQLVEVGVHCARRADQRSRERSGDLALADARRPVEQVRVRRPLAQRRIQEPPRLGMLEARTFREGRERAHEPPPRSHRLSANRRP